MRNEMSLWVPAAKTDFALKSFRSEQGSTYRLC